MTKPRPRRCSCRCHAGGGTNVSCNLGPVQPGGERACMFAADHVDPNASTGGRASVSGDLCPGSCNRDWRRLTDDEQRNPEHTIRPAMGDPIWCTPCARRIDQALREFPDLYAHLEADFAARTSQPGEGGHTKQVNAPSPSPQVDEQEAVAVWLTQLEDLVRAGRNFTPRRDPVLHGRAHIATTGAAVSVARPEYRSDAIRELREALRDLHDAEVLAASEGRLATCRAAVLAAADRARRAGVTERTRPAAQDLTLVRITTAAALVRGSLDWLLASEWAVEKGAEILQRRGRLRAVTMSGSGSKHYGRPCPRCELKTLRQQPGDEHIECQNCGRLLTLDEYNRLGQDVAS